MTTRLPKAALSQYLRTRCDRMLAFSISEGNPSADTLLALPARPGLAGFKGRGIDFEQAFLTGLADPFPQRNFDVHILHPPPSHTAMPFYNTHRGSSRSQP